MIPGLFPPIPGDVKREPEISITYHVKKQSTYFRPGRITSREIQPRAIDLPVDVAHSLTRAERQGRITPPVASGPSKTKTTIRPFRKAVIVVGSHGPRRVSQYESELMTSPPLIVPSAIQVCGLIEFFMKWTEPSPKRVLTPPGCRLREPLKAAPSDDEL
jgi:hypothetical protein